MGLGAFSVSLAVKDLRASRGVSMQKPLVTDVLLIAGFATVVFVGSACRGEFIGGPPSIARVEIRESAIALAVGDSVQLHAVAYATDGRPITSSKVKIAWTTQSPEIATVAQATGWVRALRPGTAALSSSARGRSDTESVLVVPR